MCYSRSEGELRTEKSAEPYEKLWPLIPLKFKYMVVSFHYLAGSRSSLTGTRPGCKLHLVYNVDGEWIDDFKVTGVRKNDSPVSLQLRILPNKIYVFDKA